MQRKSRAEQWELLLGAQRSRLQMKDKTQDDDNDDDVWLILGRVAGLNVHWQPLFSRLILFVDQVTFSLLPLLGQQFIHLNDQNLLGKWTMKVIKHIHALQRMNCFHFGHPVGFPPVSKCKISQTNGPNCN